MRSVLYVRHSFAALITLRSGGIGASRLITYILSLTLYHQFLVIDDRVSVFIIRIINLIRLIFPEREHHSRPILSRNSTQEASHQVWKRAPWRALQA